MDNYSPISNNSNLLDNQITNQLNSQFNQPNVSEHYSPLINTSPSQPQPHTQPPPLSLPQQTQIQPTPSIPLPITPSILQPYTSVKPTPTQIPTPSPVTIPGVQVSGNKLGGQAEQLFKGVLSRSTKMILFYIVLSVSLMCAYAWSEAMKGIVKKYLTLSINSEVDNIIYASVITLIVVVFVQILELAGADVGTIALKNISGIIQS